MDKFVSCSDCKCLVNKQCRRKPAEIDQHGYGVWPEMKYNNSGCFDGKMKVTKLSDIVAGMTDEV